jgi:hypothetical protein
MPRVKSEEITGNKNDGVRLFHLKACCCGGRLPGFWAANSLIVPEKLGFCYHDCSA